MNILSCLWFVLPKVAVCFCCYIEYYDLMAGAIVLMFIADTLLFVFVTKLIKMQNELIDVQEELIDELEKDGA